MQFIRILSLMLAAWLLAVPVSAASPNAAEEAAMAQFIAVQADGESYAVRLAMAAVLLNRLGDPRFPDTVSGILEMAGYAAGWPSEGYRISLSAVRAAAEGMDPTDGAVAWARRGTAEAAGIRTTFAVGDWVFGTR